MDTYVDGGDGDVDGEDGDVDVQMPDRALRAYTQSGGMGHGSNGRFGQYRYVWGIDDGDMIVIDCVTALRFYPHVGDSTPQYLTADVTAVDVEYVGVL